MKNHLSLEELQLRKTADLLYSSRLDVREEAKAELIAAGEAVIPFIADIISGKEAERLGCNYDEMHAIPKRHLFGDWVAREAAEVLAAVGKSAVPILVSLLDCKEDKASEAVVSVLWKEPLLCDAVPLVLPLLQHKSASVKAAAARILANSDIPQVGTAFRAVLEREVERLKRSRWRRKRYLGFIVMLYLTGLVFIFVSDGKRWGSYVTPALQFINLIGSIFAIRGMTSLSTEAFRALEGKFNVRQLGMLIMCLEGGYSGIREMAMPEIRRILSEVRASDRQYLNDEEMKILLKQLNGEDESFIIAILKGLEQIGDERALPYVERLAQKSDPKRRKTVKEILLTPIGEKKPDVAAFATVSEAARACLPFLHQRIQEAQVSSTLLRASSQNGVSNSEELLRPASANTERHEAELLRATSG